MKEEAAAPPSGHPASKTATPEQDGDVSGLDELMLLSQSRHLSEEPAKAAPLAPAAAEAPAAAAAPAAAQEGLADGPAKGAEAVAAKTDEVREALRTHPVVHACVVCSCMSPRAGLKH